MVHAHQRHWLSDVRVFFADEWGQCPCRMGGSNNLRHRVRLLRLRPHLWQPLEDILEINNTPRFRFARANRSVQDNGSSIDGFTLEQWLWDFDEGDAELVFDGNAITHTYDEPGAYTISLSVG